MGISYPLMVRSAKRVSNHEGTESRASSFETLAFDELLRMRS
jgi:hypothetical protein